MRRVFLLPLLLLVAPGAPCASGWLDEALSEIRQAEYSLEPSPGGTCTAPNRSLGLRVSSSHDGIVLAPRARTDRMPWQVALTVPLSRREAPGRSTGACDGGEGYASSVTNEPGRIVHHVTILSSGAELDVRTRLEVELLDGVLVFRDAQRQVLSYGPISGTDSSGAPVPVSAVLDGLVLRLSVSGAALYPVTLSGVVTTPSWTAEGGQEGAVMGWSVSAAGDVNGDGYGDVIIGAPGYDRGQADEGRVFVYLGSASGLSTRASWSAEGNQEGAQMGWAVANAGDLDSDGYDDIAVGANRYDGGFANEGAVFVWMGSRSGLGPPGKPANADWSALGGQPGAQMGYSVAGAGDTDGDGYDDLVTGAWLHDSGQIDEGGAFLYRGGPAGPETVASWSARGGQESAYLGMSVAGAGDLDGDGYGDLVVGAPFLSTSLEAAGTARVYPGSPSGPEPLARWILVGNQPYSQLGYSVASAGDVDGDGYGDLIVGARGQSNGETLEGMAMVFHGSSSGLSLAASWTAESDRANALFGYSVAPAGDVDGDGYDDVLVGADGFTEDQAAEGRVYLFLGSAAGLSASADWVFDGGSDSGFLGRSVSGAGDVDGDGLDDILVGGDGLGDLLNEGRALLFKGTP